MCVRIWLQVTLCVGAPIYTSTLTGVQEHDKSNKTCHSLYAVYAAPIRRLDVPRHRQKVRNLYIVTSPNYAQPLSSVSWQFDRRLSPVATKKTFSLHHLILTGVLNPMQPPALAKGRGVSSPRLPHYTCVTLRRQRRVSTLHVTAVRQESSARAALGRWR